jgi:hypothetical protein
MKRFGHVVILGEGLDALRRPYARPFEHRSKEMLLQAPAAESRCGVCIKWSETVGGTNTQSANIRIVRR